MPNPITILLAGPSAAGKSTLAASLPGKVFSTSDFLRRNLGKAEFAEGQGLTVSNPGWVCDNLGGATIVDAIRDARQDRFPYAVRANVLCRYEERKRRAQLRGRDLDGFDPYLFGEPDYVWHSDRVPLAHAVSSISALAGLGLADVVVGGQYGSEGKGKLCAHLAPGYDVLVRSGGPNAGHWVRQDGENAWEYCFHQVPSGAKSNLRARIFIAAGATLWVPDLMVELGETDCAHRTVVDFNAATIDQADRDWERGLVKSIGSTAQGVGSVTSRKVLRGGTVVTAGDHPLLSPLTGKVSRLLAQELSAGSRVLIEGTQGSGLSLHHGPYPFATSRDTNVGGLLAEVGVPPSRVGEVWMVVRTYPIRVGGNSGPMRDELSWDEVAQRCGEKGDELRKRELTSTTRRLRRVGEFDWDQFGQACDLNRPSRLFLTFADYLTPEVQGRTWQSLVPQIRRFADRLEEFSGTVVAGISVGPRQSDTIWRPGFDPIRLASEKQVDPKSVEMWGG